MKVFEGTLLASGLRMALVASRFNDLVTEQLVRGAEDAFRRHGGAVDALELYRSPGAFEISPIVRALARSGRYEGVVALGAVIRGATPHFDFIAAEVTKGVAQVSLEVPCAIALGVLTCDTMEQALERAGLKAGNAGAAAMVCAIEQARVLAAAGGRTRASKRRSR